MGEGEWGGGDPQVSCSGETRGTTWQVGGLKEERTQALPLLCLWSAEHDDTVEGEIERERGGGGVYVSVRERERERQRDRERQRETERDRERGGGEDMRERERERESVCV